MGTTGAIARRRSASASVSAARKLCGPVAVGLGRTHGAATGLAILSGQLAGRPWTGQARVVRPSPAPTLEEPVYEDDEDW